MTFRNLLFFHPVLFLMQTFSSRDVSVLSPCPPGQPRLFTSAAPQSLSLNIINVSLGLLSLSAAGLSAAVRRLLSAPPPEKKFQLLTLKQTTDPFPPPFVFFSLSSSKSSRPEAARTAALCDPALRGLMVGLPSWRLN